MCYSERQNCAPSMDKTAFVVFKYFEMVIGDLYQYGFDTCLSFVIAYTSM